ncbi:MAG: HD domain-containing protein [Syntrophomonadaceae bacterium]|nr:HD domain-containing protein [Syntrophomonadaceae bacterium]
MDKKGPFTCKELKSITPGSQVWGKYLILDKNQRRSKDGREIINLKIGDASDEIDVVVWDNCSVTGELENGILIGLLGDMSNYNNRAQVTARRIKVLDEDIIPYIKKPDIDMESLKAEFRSTMTSISDPHIKALLERIFTEETREKFFQSTAAKKVHHNYPGGLLEHTITVARLCRDAAVNYPMVNRDLLLAGALLHDIGKMDEYEMKVVADYTMEGKLVGHIILGVEKISSTINDIRREAGEFPLELELMIKHMILSHHGSLEFGSPVIPLFPEAFLLHMMDNLDAKMFVFCNKVNDEDGDKYFSNYDNFFGQQFFKYRYSLDEEETGCL